MMARPRNRYVPRSIESELERIKREDGVNTMGESWAILKKHSDMGRQVANKAIIGDFRKTRSKKSVFRRK